MLVERVEKLAISDRQAALTAALMAGAEEYTPIDVGARMAAFEELLCSDPAESGDALVERRINELLEA